MQTFRLLAYFMSWRQTSIAISLSAFADDSSDPSALHLSCSLYPSATWPCSVNKIMPSGLKFPFSRDSDIICSLNKDSNDPLLLVILTNIAWNYLSPSSSTTSRSTTLHLPYPACNAFFLITRFTFLYSFMFKQHFLLLRVVSTGPKVRVTFL